MTKFLKKVFVCGVLLSSVSAYCDDTGIVTELYTKLEDGKLTLAESSLVVTETQETHTDVVIGALDDTLTLNPEPKEIRANAFPIATTNDGKVWKYFDDSSALDIIPVGGSTAVYKTYGGSNQYICLASDPTDSENKLYEKFSSDGKWYVNTNSSDLTSETVAIATEVKVIDLNEPDTSYSLATTGDKPDLLFNGVLATKASGGVWTLSDGTTPLPRVKLEVNAGILTIGDKQEEISGANIQTLEGSSPVSGEPTTLDYARNTSGSTIKFTEFATVSAGSTLQLLDAQDPNYEKVEVSESSFKETDINNPIFETKAIFEPGSEAGASGSPVSISGGTTDLGQYLNKGDTVTGNNTDGEKLNLTIAGNVDVFSGIVPSTAQASDKSAAIDMFNESSASGVFQGISGTFNVDVPYTYNVGSTAYNSIVDLVPNNVSAEDKVSLNIASKAKVGGLFSDSSTITYTMNGKPTENLSALVDETIEYAHAIEKANISDDPKTVFLDVSSVKKFDDTFKSDEYFYSGPAGTQAVNVIPLDGDAYVIPYDNKTTESNPTTFDLKATTSLNSDAIKKYIEPNMSTVKILDSDGVAFSPQPTITVSTELSVGQDKTKTLLMNKENNDLNEGKGPNLTLTGCDLKVKSKTGDEINRNILTLKNSKAILSGTNTVQNINMDSNSTLRIRGNFSFGTAAV